MLPKHSNRLRYFCRGSLGVVNSTCQSDTGVLKPGGQDPLTPVGMLLIINQRHLSAAAVLP